MAVGTEGCSLRSQLIRVLGRQETATGVLADASAFVRQE